MSDRILVDVLMDYIIEGNKDKVYEVVSGVEDVNQMIYRGSSMLHFAAAYGHLEITEFLIGKKHRINWKEEQTGLSPLHKAVSQGHIKIVKLLVQKGADILQADYQGKQPIHWAAECGHHQILNFLLSKGQRKMIGRFRRPGMDVMTRDHMGRIPLHYAARGGYLLCGEILLSPKYQAKERQRSTSIEVDIQDHDGSTPFFYAVSGGHQDFVEMLLQKGANIEVQNQDGDTPLLESIQKGHVDIFVDLILIKADISKVNHQGLNAYLMAAKLGYFKIVERLLDMGADLNATDTEGRNALMLAIQNQHHRVSEMLIQKEISTEQTDEEGRDALYYCVRWGQQETMLLLLDKVDGFELNQPEIERLFHTSIEEGYLPIFYTLFSKLSTWNASHLASKRLMLKAAEKGTFELVQMLRDKGVSLEVIDEDGNSLLHLAAQTGDETLVMYFLEAGLRVDERNDFQETPLHKAADYGRSIKVVKCLLQRGADLGAENQNHKTPIQVAAQKTQFHVFEILMQKQPDNLELKNALIKSKANVSPKLAKLLKRSKKLMTRFRRPKEAQVQDEKKKKGDDFYTRFKHYLRRADKESYPPKLREEIEAGKIINNYRVLLFAHWVLMMDIHRVEQEMLFWYAEQKGEDKQRSISELMKILYYSDTKSWVQQLVFDIDTKTYSEQPYSSENLKMYVPWFDMYIAPVIEKVLIDHYITDFEDDHMFTYDSVVQNRLLELRTFDDLTDEERQKKCSLYEKKQKKIRRSDTFLSMKSYHKMLSRYLLLSEQTELPTETVHSKKEHSKKEHSKKEHSKKEHSKKEHSEKETPNSGIVEERKWLETKLPLIFKENPSEQLKKFEELIESINFCQSSLVYVRYLMFKKRYIDEN